MTEEQLAAGILAARNGDRTLACKLLSQAIHTDPRNATAWLWLGRSLDDAEKKKFCFQRALEIAPWDSEARWELDLLNKAPTAQQPIAQPAPQPSVQSPKQEPPAEPARSAPANIKPNPPAAKQPEPEPQKPGVFDRILALTIGLVAGLMLIGVPLFLLITSGKADAYINIQPEDLPPFVISTYTPIPSASRTSTQTPTPTPSLTPTLNAEQMQSTVDALRHQALVYMASQQYAEAIPYWDLYLNLVQTDADGYFQRGKAYIKLVGSNRSIKEYVDYCNQTITDMDRAIELDPTQGNYYLYRGFAYEDLAGNSDLPSRVDRAQYYEVAFENYKTAYVLGSEIEFPDRLIIASQIEVGYCQKSLEESLQLIRSRGPMDPISAGLNQLVAESYECLGQAESGLSYITTSLDLAYTSYRQYLKELMLFNAGHLEEARQSLLERIEKNPDFGGNRYFLLALIEHDLGMPDDAAMHLSQGIGNTWGYDGIYLYVEGLLALDNGDRDTGIELLREAEYTMPYIYGPLISRIRDELKELGAEPIEPTPQRILEVTPMPTLQATLSFMSSPTPTGNPGAAENQQPTIIATPQSESIYFDINTGTGPITFQSNEDDYLFHTRINESVPLQEVRDFVIHVISANPQGNPTLMIMVYLPRDGGGWRQIYHPQYGANRDGGINPAAFISPEGDIYFSVRNYKDTQLTIDNFGITVTLVDSNGNLREFGLPLE